MLPKYCQELDGYEEVWFGPDGTRFESKRLAVQEATVSILFTAYAHDRDRKDNLEYCLRIDRDLASRLVMDTLVTATREWFELMFYYGSLIATETKEESSAVIPNTLCRVYKPVRWDAVAEAAP